MDEIAIISTPISEAWPMWLMFFLLLCVVLAEVLQPGTLRLAFRTTFTRLERTFGDRANNFMSSLLMNTFRVGTIAMALYVFFYHSAPFSMLTYCYIVVLLVGILFVKMLVSWLVSYTFEMRRSMVVFLPQYDNLWTILSIVLYPLTLLYINVSGSVALYWICVAAVVLFVVMIVFKMMQNYYTGPQSLIYLVLYVLTLEFVPFGAIFLSVKAIA